MPTHKKLAIRVQNSRLFGMTFQNTKTPRGLYPEEFLCISEDVAKRSNICFLEPTLIEQLLPVIYAEEIWANEVGASSVGVVVVVDRRGLCR